MTAHQVQLIGFALLSLSIGCYAQQAPPSTSTAPLPQLVEFNRDIRPILSDKCYTCHGPGRQMGGLRFDREDVAKQELKSGKIAVVPGDTARSEMIRRVSAVETAVRMPRGAEPLSAREVAVLGRWVQQGAKWQKHWSLIPPARPDLPKLTDASWVHNAIDSFVLDRLRREGLKPSPQADRATLLRRVTFDLTGLPPTPAELNAFLADHSPNAYEKVVDRLLASPRYGERMAFTWLDAARYADSNGYQGDGERQMWRWRDWVIDAFNRNMPFDEFAVEQLAGDLLPNATVSQRVATGFNRNHRGNSEGGIIPEEYRVEYVIDRAETTGTVFMGLTVGCARCHDHKYDPITQKDFYQLFAYFNNIPESGRAHRVGNSPPVVQAPTPDQQAQLKQYDDKLSLSKANFQKMDSELKVAQASWEGTLDKSKQIVWGPNRGLVAYYPLDGDITAKVAVPPEKKQAVPMKAVNGDARFGQGRFARAAQFDGKSFLEAGDIVGFASHGTYDDKYTLAAWIFPTAPTGAIVTKVGDVVEPKGHGLNLKDGKIQYNLVSKWLDEGIRLQTEESVSLNQWHQLTLTYDGSRLAEGVKLYIDGKEAKWEVLLDDMNNSIQIKREPLRIGGGGGPDNRFHGAIQEVRIYDRDLSAAEAAVLNDPSAIPEIASLAPTARSPAQADKIHDYFLENVAPAKIQKAWHDLLDAQKQRDTYSDGLPTVMVMEERAVPRESHLLIRGVYDRPGDLVSPALPAFLVSPDNKFAPTRLGLAKWLVDPSNPLLSRVTVNRFWQMYFGTGLVKTVEDFGSQGDAPSHPELLDWLATEFIATRWDVKKFQKTIVMSATYQQSSRTTPEIAQRDPENRLLSHGPRFRLPAPMVRDQALAISGLLVNQLGGPSVKPYQPDGLWQELSDQVYTQDHGDKLYRRSLYTFWKRTIPPPTMATFDASSRESCVVRQNLTNTPLQALDLMNDVAFLEAARVFAQRVMEDGKIAPEQRIVAIFRFVMSRLPDNEELRILNDYFHYQLDAFASKPDAALKYLAAGEYSRDPKLNVNQLAAYSTVASFILNLDEAITKE
ncbi:MAG: hypothetical protein C5B51_13335 [Terriglobia bacterium]|nr:MAG: hypothetical protein C5B51_13335 [Terriglobia bacterium]